MIEHFDKQEGPVVFFYTISRKSKKKFSMEVHKSTLDEACIFLNGYRYGCTNWHIPLFYKD